MARLYKVSADTSEKEKAVGGIMTFHQAGWLALGLMLSGAGFLILATILPPILGLMLGVPPGVILGCSFAFYQKEGLPLFTYLMYQRSFRRKSKQLVNDLTYGKTFQKEDELFC